MEWNAKIMFLSKLKKNINFSNQIIMIDSFEYSIDCKISNRKLLFEDF